MNLKSSIIKNRVIIVFLFFNLICIIVIFQYYNGALTRKLQTLEVAIFLTNNGRSSAVKDFEARLQNIRQRTLNKVTMNSTELTLNENPIVSYDTGFRATNSSELNKLTLEQLYRYYLTLITETTFDCGERIRFGNIGDGGWDICNEGFYKVQSPCTVYSMGINWDFSFDDALTKSLGCEVHAFDPSMKMPSYKRSPLIYFYNYGLKGREVNQAKQQNHDQTKFEVHTFGEILNALQHRNRTIDYYKMDIDGPEWRALDLMLNETLMSHIRQFAFEGHIFAWEFTIEKFIQVINVLERMKEAGFELFLSHKNPTGYFNKSDINETIFCCYEVYYVNTKFRPGIV